VRNGHGTGRFMDYTVQGVGPGPLFLVLNIVHCNFKEVPKTLSLNQIYRLLTFTERYEMTPVVKPWIRAWWQPLRSATGRALTDVPQLSSVAYIVGDTRGSSMRQTGWLWSATKTKMVIWSTPQAKEI
jgi:hypothetical protein